jgi:hypothetical protein
LINRLIGAAITHREFRKKKRGIDTYLLPCGLQTIMDFSLTTLPVETALIFCKLWTWAMDCMFIYLCFKVRKIVLEGRAKCLRKTLCLYFLPLFFSRFPQSFPIWVLGVLGHAAVISAAATSVVRDSYFRHLATCTPQHLSSPFLFFLYC